LTKRHQGLYVHRLMNMTQWVVGQWPCGRAGGPVHFYLPLLTDCAKSKALTQYIPLIRLHRCCVFFVTWKCGSSLKSALRKRQYSATSHGNWREWKERAARECVMNNRRRTLGICARDTPALSFGTLLWSVD